LTFTVLQCLLLIISTGRLIIALGLCMAFCSSSKRWACSSKDRYARGWGLQSRIFI